MRRWKGSYSRALVPDVVCAGRSVLMEHLSASAASCRTACRAWPACRRRDAAKPALHGRRSVCVRASTAVEIPTQYSKVCAAAAAALVQVVGVPHLGSVLWRSSIRRVCL